MGILLVPCVELVSQNITIVRFDSSPVTSRGAATHSSDKRRLCIRGFGMARGDPTKTQQKNNCYTRGQT